MRVTDAGGESALLAEVREGFGVLLASGIHNLDRHDAEDVDLNDLAANSAVDPSALTKPHGAA